MYRSPAASTATALGSTRGDDLRLGPVGGHPLAAVARRGGDHAPWPGRRPGCGGCPGRPGTASSPRRRRPGHKSPRTGPRPPGPRLRRTPSSPVPANVEIRPVLASTRRMRRLAVSAMYRSPPGPDLQRMRVVQDRRPPPGPPSPPNPACPEPATVVKMPPGASSLRTRWPGISTKITRPPVGSKSTPNGLIQLRPLGRPGLIAVPTDTSTSRSAAERDDAQARRECRGPQAVRNVLIGPIPRLSSTPALHLGLPRPDHARPAVRPRAPAGPGFRARGRAGGWRGKRGNHHGGTEDTGRRNQR